MIIVIDTNIIFSALIKKGITRRLFLDFKGIFLYPEYAIEELKDHIEEILKKSKIPKEDFYELLRILFRKIKIIRAETLKRYEKEADKIVKDIDPDDSMFFACALAYPGSVIWSNDLTLKKQNRIRIIDTGEMLRILSQHL